jgi:hypothetical protein
MVSHDFLDDSRAIGVGTPRIIDLNEENNQITVRWTGQGHHDKYLLYWSENGGPQTQVVCGGGDGGSFTLPIRSGLQYTF